MAIADPTPLGLAGFAVTTFLLSGYNVGFIPDLAWTGPAAFGGGLIQLLAGLIEFGRGNVFGATAFGTFGGFWMSLTFLVLLKLGDLIPVEIDFVMAIGYFLMVFFIFNTYMWIASFMTPKALTLVFFLIETEFILLLVGHFQGQSAGVGWTAAGGYAGIFGASSAFYFSAASLINNMAGGVILPVGVPFIKPGFRCMVHISSVHTHQYYYPNHADQTCIV
jgi:succinate-acetate transporter protein